MQPNRRESCPQDDLFRSRLEQIIDMRHQLVALSKLIDWDLLSERNAIYYHTEGRPGVDTRLMVGLHLLKYIYDLSDEGVCERWEYDPYFQYFCGEEFFQHELKMERSSMTHWRNRVGEEFFEELLQESLRTAYESGALRKQDLRKVAVDTTVQPKAITFPTDTKLQYKAIERLVDLSKKHGVNLRQSYLYVGKRELIKAGRYRHAKQMKRAKKSQRKLKTYLGRLIRDIQRKIALDETLKIEFSEALKKAKKIHEQKRSDGDKLYSWHAPEVECISKGKADKPYEFGCKVSITTNIKRAPGGHFILHSQAMHGRPYDGHTLKQAIEGMRSLTGLTPRRIYVDKGYRGHNYEKKLRVFRSGQKRGVTKSIKRELRRRSLVEAVIGHSKNEHRMDRNFLRGRQGDKVNALLSAMGYNFRRILQYLADLFCLFLRWIFWSIARTPAAQPLK